MLKLVYFDLAIRYCISRKLHENVSKSLGRFGKDPYQDTKMIQIRTRLN